MGLKYYERFTPRVSYRETPDGKLITESFDSMGVVRDSELKTFRWAPSEKHEVLSGTLRLTRNKPVYLERFELVLAADEKKSPFVSLHDDISPDSGLRLFQHGYHSWSWTGARQADETDNICLLKWKHNLDENPETQINSALPFSLPINVFPRKGKFHSEFLVLLETNTKFLKKKNGKCILFSTYGRGDQFLKFRIHLDPRTAKLEEFAIVWDGAGMHMPGSTIITLTQVKHFNSIHVRPRTRVRLKRTQPSPAEFLESCAKEVASEFKTPKMENSVTGWCSWYYYYNKISEGVLLRNLRLVKEKKLNIDFFQIDDGWQKNIGDWLKTAPEFPSGMAFFSKAIKNEGLRPGIWLAPFIARPDSDVFKENKEFVLHDQHGDPVSALFNPLWGGHTYAFDVTHPRFKEWISETIRTIVFDWGYPYLKLDFLYSACYRGVYHDPRKGPAVRLRESLDLVRKVAGKKTFLLGCGCPIMPGIGPFDAMRIGRDVNSIWDDNLLATIIKDRNYPTAEGCLQNAITRSFMHRKFFVNDPDCILVRDTNTKLSLDQVHLMTAVMSLTGGMILLSDDLETLSPDRMEIFRMALKIHKDCAKHTALPLGLMEDHFPRGLYNKAGYLGIWNPTNRAERIQILLPEGLGPKLTRSTNLWDNRRIPWRIEDDTLEMSLAPFESVLTKV